MSRYESMRNNMKIAVSKAMSDKAELGLDGLRDYSNGVFQQVRALIRIVEKLKEEDAMDVVVENCASVRRKYVVCGKTVENGWKLNVETD